MTSLPLDPADSPTDPGIRPLADGSLHVGAGASLATIAAHPLVRERYALLAQACEHPGNEASLAADLGQRGECRYLREGAPCLKNGGTSCLAIEGDNRYLAIVEGGPSWIIHPSEAGVALAALEATIEIAGPAGRRDVPAEEFFVLPTERLDSETALRAGESVHAVRLPASAALGVHHFTLVREPDSGVVLVSLAAVRRTDGDVRLVLGRVSPRPYRIYNSIEEETTTGGLDEDTIEGLAQRALLDAAPLSQNAWKLDLAEGLLRDAIRALASA